MLLLSSHGCSKGYEGSCIPLLKGFMVSLYIRIYGLPLSNYLNFILLGNTASFNIVYVVLAAPMRPVLGCLIVYF